MARPDPEEVQRAEAEDQRLHVARIGMEIEAEIAGSTFAQYIIARAREEAQQAIWKLVEHNASDAEGIRELQHTIKRHWDIQNWMKEGVSAGEQAAHDIEMDAYVD